MTSRALVGQVLSPRLFACLKGSCSHRTLAEAEACDAEPECLRGHKHWDAKDVEECDAEPDEPEPMEIEQ